MPCDPTTIERLNALEHSVEELRRENGKELKQQRWKNIVGTFANNPAFDEAMEYGRRIRAGEMAVPALPE